MKTTKLLWFLQIVPAIIFLQTLFFKFTGAPEAVAIFTALGVEPWGRILTGIFELVAAVLLLIPTTVIYGALLAFGLMIGAIFSHLLFLGISSAGDGGALFIMAIVVLIFSSIILYMRKSEIPFLGSR